MAPIEVDEIISNEDNTIGSGGMHHNVSIDVSKTYPHAGGNVIQYDPKYVSTTESGYEYLGSALKKDKEKYTDKERATNYNRTKKGLENTINSYDDEFTRLIMDPHYKDNHAKINWRGNLNNRSYNATLNLSRAADRLNNKRHWVPNDIGASTTLFGSSGINLPHSERWEPVETQDMRQMRANENIDIAQRQGDVRRADTVLGNNIQMQQRLQNDVSDIAKLIGTSDIQVDTALRNAANSVNVNLPANAYITQVLARYNQELLFETKSRTIQAICNAYNSYGDLFGQVVSELLSGASGYSTDEAYMQEFQKVIYSQTGSWTEAHKAKKALEASFAVVYTKAMLDGLSKGSNKTVFDR